MLDGKEERGRNEREAKRGKGKSIGRTHCNRMSLSSFQLLSRMLSSSLSLDFQAARERAEDKATVLTEARRDETGKPSSLREPERARGRVVVVVVV